MIFIFIILYKYNNIFIYKSDNTKYIKLSRKFKNEQVTITIGEDSEENKEFNILVIL